VKLFKFILVLFVTVSISSCSEDPREPTILLSNANIAGTHSINSFNLDTKVTSETDVSGVSVPFDIATSTGYGDTFQVDFELTENGDYTLIGQYRLTSTVTPAIGSQVSETSILLVDDSGTYEIDTTNNTITFTSSLDALLDFSLDASSRLSGTFNVVTFNETAIVLRQEKEEVLAPVTTQIKTNIRFERN